MTRTIGATLKHDGKPITSASKSFTAVEERFANIERLWRATIGSANSRQRSKKDFVRPCMRRGYLQVDRKAATPEMVLWPIRKQLQALVPGQSVTIEEPEMLKWKPAEVNERLDGVPSSYVVTALTGRELRRNRVHIQEAHQDDALGPNSNEQSSPYDTPSISPYTIKPPDPDPPCS